MPPAVAPPPLRDNAQAGPGGKIVEITWVGHRSRIGKANEQTAVTELGVSVNTVGTHLRYVFAKLGIQSRVQPANELHKADLT